MKKRLTKKSNSPGLKIFLSKRLRHYFKVFCILFVICFVSWALYFFVNESDFFSIKTIKLVGTEKYVSEQDVAEISKTYAKNKNILFFNDETFSQMLQKNFEGAKSFQITKQLPSTLLITIKERKPLALITKTNTTDLYMIDDEGYVLGGIDQQIAGLPTLYYNGDIKTGTYINKDLIPSYLELIKYLDESNLKISSLSFYPKYSEFYLNNHVQVLVGNDKNKNEAVKLIKNLLEQTAEEKQNITKVDLRYEKVIVSY